MNFSVREHIKYVDLYSNEDSYNCLTSEDTKLVKDELSPLIHPSKEDSSAQRFDALMYGIELASMVGKKYSRAKKDLLKKVDGISRVSNIPEIHTHEDLIKKILHTDYLENAGIDDFEHIREELRDLMKYIPKDLRHYDTNFSDEILSVEINDAEFNNNDLQDSPFTDQGSIVDIFSDMNVWNGIRSVIEQINFNAVA